MWCPYLPHSLLATFKSLIVAVSWVKKGILSGSGHRQPARWKWSLTYYKCTELPENVLRRKTYEEGALLLKRGPESIMSIALKSVCM